MASQAWDVYGPYRLEAGQWVRVSRSREIDTVFFDADINADDVRRSLIDHDGYPVDIRVERA